MNTSQYIYTIGHKPLLDHKMFIANIKKYGINCLVDIRQQPNLSSLYSVENLKALLTANGIWYISFHKEFGITDINALQGGKIVYKKVITTQRFLDGIKRLNTGIEKGYKIVLLGEDISPTFCYRNIILGRYLTENGWGVYHILSDGTALSQNTLTENIEKYNLARKKKKESAAQIGFDGEEIAASYLIEHGYRILERNWNLHHGCELDIVAFKDYTLHAIEVKTRSKEDIAPEMAITQTKLKHIAKAFQEYRYSHHLLKIPCQIDSITVIMRSNTDYTVNMYENLTFFIRGKFY